MGQKISLPDFQIEESKIPHVRLKSIRFQSFKAFDDHCFYFSNSNGKVKPFVCFIGPNGCGKTTVLDCIQMIFSRFEGMETDRLKLLLGKSVRHIEGKQTGIYGDDDFLVTAHIECSLGDYEVQINKSGFVKDHPLEVKSLLYRLCFYARFDQELHNFQLSREKWPLFKDLFEAVTGFRIEELIGVFDQSSDPIANDMLKKYVLGFQVYKPDEIISHRECSAGEKKIIKSFSTLLTKEYNPQIILIDNVAMHVESGRHLQLVKSMKRCFPKSQIFCTTHSYNISRNFGERNQLYDLRLIKASSIIKKEPWRLYLADEIIDCLSKLNVMTVSRKIVEDEVARGEKLVKSCFQETEGQALLDESQIFMKKVAGFFIQDVVEYNAQR